MKKQVSDQSQSLISQSQSDKEKQQVKPVRKVIIQSHKNIIHNKQQKKKTYQQIQQVKKPTKKIYLLNDPQLQQPSKTNTLKTQQFKDLPKRIIKQYEQKVAKDFQNNSCLLPISSSQTNKILIYLKQIHLQQQINQVKKIKQMSQESKLILDDLTNIQNQIDKYQQHIDLWIGKIRGYQNNIEKIKSAQGTFQKKAINMSKLKDFLHVERTRRR